MRESPLARVLRLASVPVHQYQRVSGGRNQVVHGYAQNRTTGGLRLGTPYRVAWSNVSIGDVLEFGQTLWKVVPATAYPGYKPPTSSGKSTSSGTGAQTGGSTTGTSSGSSAGSSSSTGNVPGTTQTYTNYLQDVRDPKKFDKLTLPATYVATVVPVLP